MVMREQGSELRMREIFRELDSSRAKVAAAEERLRRMELEIAALRQLIETQTSLLSAMYAGKPAPAIGDVL